MLYCSDRGGRRQAKNIINKNTHNSQKYLHIIIYSMYHGTADQPLIRTMIVVYLYVIIYICVCDIDSVVSGSTCAAKDGRNIIYNNNNNIIIMVTCRYTRITRLITRFVARSRALP